MFPETQWTVVLAAGGTPSPESAAALERLCSSYWYPLYAYVRRRGHAPPDAQDLTQEFFTRLLEHNWIAPADRHKGRFRSFLLTAMKRFLAKEWDKVKTIKRGGQVRLVPLQLDTAETRYTREPADTCTPEQVFEKQWALALLESVLNRLREDYARDGKETLFQHARTLPHRQPRDATLRCSGGRNGDDGRCSQDGRVPLARAISGASERGDQPYGGVTGGCG